MKYEFKVNSDQVDFLKEQLERLKTYIEEKVKEKKKEWEDQIERVKWKTIVQAHGEMKYKNRYDLIGDVCCGDCHGPLYCADSEEKYAICKGCENNGLRKLSWKLKCGGKSGCSAESFCTIKWISGYKN